MAGFLEGIASYFDKKNAISDKLTQAKRSKYELEQQERLLTTQLQRATESEKPVIQEKLKGVKDAIAEADKNVLDTEGAVKEEEQQLWEETSDPANMRKMSLGTAADTMRNAANDSSAAISSIGDYFAQSAAANQNKQTLDPTGESVHLRNQAQLNQQAAGDMQKAAQQESQIANRDTKTEADKKAIAQGGVKATQIQQQLGAETGAAAGLEGMKAIENADYNYEEGRVDTARQRAVDRTKDAYDQRQWSEERQAEAGKSDYIASNENLQNIKAEALARGAGGGTNVTVTNKPESSTSADNTDSISRNGAKVDEESATETQPEETTSGEGAKVDEESVTESQPENTRPGESVTVDKHTPADTNAGFVPDTNKSVQENLDAKGTYGESRKAYYDNDNTAHQASEESVNDYSGYTKQKPFYYLDENGNKVWLGARDVVKQGDKYIVRGAVNGAQNVPAFKVNSRDVPSDGNLKNIIKSLVDCSRF